LDITQIHSLQKELRLENSFVIGYTGRLVKDKGIIELIQAFKILREDYPFLKLLLVGMFEERDVLPTEMVDFIKNNSDIIHVGYVSYESIEYYYALMDVFVLLSYREGFPTSALEASAMNLPVITTKATGCIDSIVEKETGLFVNHTIEEIVSALKYFIENESQKRVFGSAGREFVKNNFASEIIWKEIEKIYQQ
jgi:glycosyltransferase involved in cell wall biosynthesis